MKHFFTDTTIVGIDEAGRGPLAGPLAVGGVAGNPASLPGNFFRGIRDSKQLSEKKREAWFKKIAGCPKLRWSVVYISPERIDTINIWRAAQEGAWQVFRELAGEDTMHALLDGGLYLPAHISQTTIVKGDEKISFIAAASIMAKVTRDRFMQTMHHKFPQYSFDRHKGYATVLHRKNIAKYGLSSLHRVSFCKKLDSHIM